jgi:trimeric autotransporter adhesin
MNAKLKFIAICHLLSAICLTSFAQGTAFTYQGRLQNNGTPASGAYSLTFTLFTSSTGGSAVAGPVTNSTVVVTNGLFTAPIDFGAGVWNGATNWLEIGVETNGGGAFTTLSPRQRVTPTPYAITAENLDGTVGSGGLSGTYGNQVTLNNIANQFSGSFTGNGTGLMNVNAATLGGLAATGFWQTSGNSGTTPGVNFLGTTDSEPLDFRVNNVRAMRLILQTDALGIYSNAPNVSGGSSVNQISSGVVGGTIGGGGGTDKYGGTDLNTVAADFGTVGGGVYNQANGQFSTVSGGDGNIASGDYSVAGGFLNLASGLYATVGGGDQNTATNEFSTVPGGLGNGALGNAATAGGGYQNTASGATATVAGGNGNMASGHSATVAGGNANTASGDYSTVSGGANNTAGAIGSVVGGGGYDGNYGAGNQVQSRAATICGGFGNSIPGGAIYAFIGGGCFNTASGINATVSGGTNNTASGNYSFAAGSDAEARHAGSFVWSDGEGLTNFPSDRVNQFKVQAGGGVYLAVSGSSGLNPAALDVNSTSANGIALHAHMASSDSTAVFGNGGTGDIIKGFSGASQGTLVFEVLNDGTVKSKGVALTSDRNTKANFTELNPAVVLAKVTTMPVTEWNYRDDPAGTKHIGPVAQDFHAAFGLNGMDDQHISVVDEGGVALAAIQGLNEKVESQEQKEENQTEELKSENEELKLRLAKLEVLVQRLGDRQQR